MITYSAKDILVKNIDSKSANAFTKKYHYSGKVVANSQLHFGVYLPDGRLHGVMQLGPSLVKGNIVNLVADTGFNEFLEFNRMAFDDVLPKNSESRAIGVVMRMIRKFAPQIKWVISYADATQCGDGTIYRASGFVLTMIKKNDALYRIPGAGNKIIHQLSMTAHGGNKDVGRIVHEMSIKTGKGKLDFYKSTNGKASVKEYIKALGGEKLEGFQLRYIYFLHPEYRAKLRLPEVPFSEIKAQGATMYKGQRGENTEKKEVESK